MLKVSAPTLPTTPSSVSWDTVPISSLVIYLAVNKFVAKGKVLGSYLKKCSVTSGAFGHPLR